MRPTAAASTRSIRRRWHILGQVQGVGYRPFVCRLARELGLQGYVLNDARGVTVEAQGTAAALKRFSRALHDQRPPLALVDRVSAEDVAPVDDAGRSGFEILSSVEDETPIGSSDHVQASVTVDSGLCAACLSEMMDPGDRRHRYGLINCTDCGPRYTIIDRVPYDRPNTSMLGFVMCPSCRAEYTASLDRRYHAQPIACHACGPVVELVDPQGRTLDGDPYAATASMLADGKIIAVKGLGGFNLAVRADDERAVARLRRAKHRDAKPFALMCRSFRVAGRLVRLSEQAEAALMSCAAPIVLAPRLAEAGVAPSVAPDSHRLGVMLPYTPIHHLLFAELTPSIDSLVMTSANPSHEPLVIDNDEALAVLGEMCDAVLLHDRPIRRRVDDSVVLDMGEALGQVLPVRRARGYVPAALPLPVDVAEPGLCVGGELKNTVALVRGGRAVLSQHLGDLSYTQAYDHFTQTVDDLAGLFDVRPAWVAHDLHPRYLGTAHAKSLAQRWGVPLIGVQHHHAHAASVMAEHGVSGPTLSLVCDGVGYGIDGTSWGGELLLASLTSFQRLACLAPLHLPGGDAAAYDTRRCALALLHRVYGERFVDHPATALLIPDDEERRMLTAMMIRDVNCTTSTAAGRYFDGVAALLGLSDRNDYEAQAAMRLESAADDDGRSGAGGPLFKVLAGEPGTIDLDALVGHIVSGRARGVAVGELSALFHDQLGWALADAVQDASRRLGVLEVALSGGVFCNQRLTDCLVGRLSGAGLRVLLHEKVPANDGGLAYGQAAVAAAQLDAGL